MANFYSYLSGLAVVAALAVVTWVVSIQKKDASIVDSLWSILFLAAATAYLLRQDQPSERALLMWVLVTIWALRLAIYITVRNWGEEEDRRYQAIRRRNQPFAVKSLYIVFLLQGILASVVSLPLLAIASGKQALALLDYVGTGIIVFGVVFEAIGDWQLSRFKAKPENKSRVMQTGLWRHTRHPNYFGESCVWWGFYLLALAAGGWWTVVGPLLMTVMLLKVSGVALLEKDIAKRRPEYQRYIEQTNAFIPGPRKSL
jgi:steroid 5-alpha reductase family enzyme